MIANRGTAARAVSLGEVLGLDAQATEWMRDGLCAQTDPEAFYPDNGYVVPAKAVCAVCPVLAECRAYALETGERFGVWGGLSARERQRIRAGAAGIDRLGPFVESAVVETWALLANRCETVQCGNPEAHDEHEGAAELFEGETSRGYVPVVCPGVASGTDQEHRVPTLFCDWRDDHADRWVA